ncbi:NUDIX hydrolase [Luedemannella flava]|uniref:NUDIX hydrolase n=1 Tax=Luedemannella flava TaxID=349316 RepID=A0ABN2MR71_9ACTN
MADAQPVRAAGGVLVRDGLVALVHRPRYDDWTLPKGKARRGEAPVVTAWREVWEETGVRPLVRTRLTTVTYPVAVAGGTADKTVDYWTMTAGTDTGFRPGDEIDDVAWLDPTQAHDRLTYPHDIEVLAAYQSRPALTGLAVLVRHASAGKRGQFAGPDAARPLDRAGQNRAVGLVQPLTCFGPRRIISAAPRRCVQTMAPMASTLDLPIEVETAFDEAGDPAAAARRTRALAGGAGSIVVCSQGGLMPTLLAELTGGRADDFTTPKGAGWVVGFAADGAVVADRLTA